MIYNETFIFKRFKNIIISSFVLSDDFKQAIVVEGDVLLVLQRGGDIVGALCLFYL